MAAAEVWLVRVTSVAMTLPAVVLPLAVGVGLAGALGWAAEKTRFARYGGLLGSGATATYVAGGIVLYAGAEHGMRAALAPAAVTAAVVAGAAGLLAWVSRGRAPGGALVLWIGGSALVGWILRYQDLPPESTLIAAMVGWFALAAASSRPPVAVLATAAVAVLALTPTPLGVPGSLPADHKGKRRTSC